MSSLLMDHSDQEEIIKLVRPRHSQPCHAKNNRDIHDVADPREYRYMALDEPEQSRGFENRRARHATEVFAE
jgi:hypothetical protein